ncbi:MAG: hypothetical protein ACI9N0_003515 [Ilumatobacter sp.]|jgi:hypothetical protein
MTTRIHLGPFGRGARRAAGRSGLVALLLFAAMSMMPTSVATVPSSPSNQGPGQQPVTSRQHRPATFQHRRRQHRLRC